MNNSIVWFNGQLMSRDHANINVMSSTSQYGINVFEGLRAYKTIENSLAVFRFEDHIARLQSSIKLFGNDELVSSDLILKNIFKVIKANNYIEDIAVRVVMMNIHQESWSSQSPFELLVAPVPKGRTLPNDKTGYTANISTVTRISNNSMAPQIKCGANYVNSRYGQIEAKAFGFDTCLFFNENGYLAEAPGSNVFIIKDQKLYTPSRENGILLGITRDTVMQLAKTFLKIDTYEINITRYDLLNADEIFLCGSAMEIVPIIAVNNILFSTNSDSLTKKIEKIYFDLVRGKKILNHSWLSYVE